MTRTVLFLLAAVLPFLAGAQAPFPPVSTGETAVASEAPLLDYFIRAELLGRERRLLASETLTWTNRSLRAVSEMRFHLYLNAFRDPRSTFFEESGLFRRPGARQRDRHFGQMTLRRLSDGKGTDLLARARYAAPDDDNAHDRTVLIVPLAEPLAPGGSLQLQIDFELTMPEIFARSGQAGDFFFFGQWYPKPGVLMPDGSWHCHQYHCHSEFFADFARFHVEITTPPAFVLGATGHQIRSRNNPDGSVTRTFEESNVHDFAWTAWPHFLVSREFLRLAGNGAATEIILLLSPDHAADKPRYLQSLRFALTFFSERLFPYPYRTITLVDPPARALGAGGMEYPTLITGGTSRFIPDAMHMVEMVTIHEFGHQYWYGLIASDEFREAWLDEGVNTFFEMEAMKAYFGRIPTAIDSGLLDVEDWEYQRADAARLPGLDPLRTPSWRFLDGASYGGTVYAKAGLLLRSLKNLVGETRMNDFFRAYALKYRYRHPNSDDFESDFTRFMGGDWNWMFDRFVRGSENLDQAVERVSAVKLEGRPTRWRNEAVFVRREGYFPVDLSIRLADGRQVRQVWKENERWRRIVFIDSSPLSEAQLDPELKVPLDRDLLNNSRRLRPRTGGVRKLATLLAFLFQNLLALIPW
jgi:hypothetical protein